MAKVDGTAFGDFKELIIPAGWYGAKIVKVVSGPNKRGLPMGTVNVQIIDDAPVGGTVDPDVDAEPRGKWLTYYVVTPDEAKLEEGVITKKQFNGYGVTSQNFLIACGYDKDSFSEVVDEDNKIDFQALMGTELEVKVNHELINKENPDLGSRATGAYGGFRAMG